MKKVLLLSGVFFAGLAFTAYAMEEPAAPTGKDATMAPTEEKSDGDAPPAGEQLASATEAINKLMHKHVTLDNLAEQNPAQLLETARTILVLVNLILSCANHHQAAFADVSSALETLRGTQTTLNAFTAWHIVPAFIRRGKTPTPEEARAAILAVAAVAPALTKIATPLLKRNRAVYCGVTLAALVVLTAISAELIHLGYLHLPH